MNTPVLHRLVIVAATLIGVYVLPWWIPISVAFLGILIFRLYEFVIIGTLIDALYPQELFLFVNTGYFFTSLLLLTITASWILTRKIRIL